MQPLTLSYPLSFSSDANAKNSSVSIGGGYSSSGGWNVNATYTKKW